MTYKYIKKRKKSAVFGFCTHADDDTLVKVADATEKEMEEFDSISYFFHKLL